MNDFKPIHHSILVSDNTIGLEKEKTIFQKFCAAGLNFCKRNVGGLTFTLATAAAYMFMAPEFLVATMVTGTACFVANNYPSIKKVLFGSRKKTKAGSSHSKKKILSSVVTGAVCFSVGTLSILLGQYHAMTKNFLPKPVIESIMDKVALASKVGARGLIVSRPYGDDFLCKLDKKDSQGSCGFTALVSNYPFKGVHPENTTIKATPSLSEPIRHSYDGIIVNKALPPGWSVTVSL